MPGIRRLLKDFGKWVLHTIFVMGQRLGIDLLPRHFYSEIPSIRDLRRSTDWRAPYSMIGVAGGDIGSQLAFLRSCCPPEMCADIATRNIHEEAARMNGESGFGEIESEFLYAFLVARKPAQIIQIGCGLSTAVCLLAARRAGYRPEVICVDPYPSDFLRLEAEQGSIRLLPVKAQGVDLDVILGLGNDLLFFVDSSHTLGPAGEVSRIVLEMLPRLRRGAFAHFHDIFFPLDYEPNLLASALFFHHESPLLHAFLAYNSRFRLAVSLAMLHHSAGDELKVLFRHYRPAKMKDGLYVTPGHFPSSAYLEVTA